MSAICSGILRCKRRHRRFPLPGPPALRTRSRSAGSLSSPSRHAGLRVRKTLIHGDGVDATCGHGPPAAVPEAPILVVEETLWPTSPPPHLCCPFAISQNITGARKYRFQPVIKRQVVTMQQMWQQEEGDQTGRPNFSERTENKRQAERLRLSFAACVLSGGSGPSSRLLIDGMEAAGLWGSSVTPPLCGVPKHLLLLRGKQSQSDLGREE